MATTLVIFARLPAAGCVKTRLAAALGDARAAALYEAFLADLADRLRGTCDRRAIAYTPDSPEARAYFQDLAADDYVLWPQPDGTLGVRLAECFDAHLRHVRRVIVIGSDAPTLPAERIQEAAAALAASDCVLGPAVDGGYYLVALRRPCFELFTEIDWDGPDVLEQTVLRVQSAGLTLDVLSPWYDVDTVGDLHALRGHLSALRASGVDPRVPRTERLLAAGMRIADP